MWTSIGWLWSAGMQWHLHCNFQETILHPQHWTLPSISWVFIVAAIQNPVLAVDFLRHYSLLVDVRHNCLLDTLTQLQVQSIVSHDSFPSPILHPARPKTNCKAVRVTRLRNTRLQLRWSDICAWSLSISVCTCTVSSSTQHSAGDPGSPCQQSRHPATCGESASPPQFPLTHPWVQPLWVSWFHQILLLLYLATILSDPKPSAPMSIISNTSDIAMGAVLQQPIRGSITYFSNKLKPRETQYSTFDHELIGVCLAI